MKHRFAHLVLALALAGASVSTLALSTPASAAKSAYCTTLESFASTKAPNAANVNTYKKWLKTYGPYFTKLANEAPNASVRAALTNLVSIINAEESSNSSLGLDSAIVKHEKKWAKDWLAFERSVLACVSPGL